MENEIDDCSICVSQQIPDMANRESPEINTLHTEPADRVYSGNSVFRHGPVIVDIIPLNSNRTEDLHNAAPEQASIPPFDERAV